MMTWASMFIIGALLLSNYMSKLSDDWSERGSIITGKMVDVLSNMLSVRLFSRQKNEISMLFPLNTNAGKNLNKIKHLRRLKRCV
jgi:ATP-binding cassette subfamily B protein